MNYLISEEKLWNIIGEENYHDRKAKFINIIDNEQPVKLVTCIDTPDSNNFLYLKELNDIGQTRKSQLCKIGKGHQRLFIQEVSK